MAERKEKENMAKAAEAFKKAASGRINPSELETALREVMQGGAWQDGGSGLYDDLKEFVELDLSDYAYSLAIHDQSEINKLNERIAEWAGRLEAELGSKG